jgi:hypothetical protein
MFWLSIATSLLPRTPSIGTFAPHRSLSCGPGSTGFGGLVFVLIASVREKRRGLAKNPVVFVLSGAILRQPSPARSGVVH